MIYLIFWKTIVKRVTVVKLGLYDRGGNCFGGVKVKVGTDTAIHTVIIIFVWFCANRPKCTIIISYSQLGLVHV